MMNYGPGDYQTWGYHSPEPSEEECAYEKVDIDESTNLRERLSCIYPDWLIDSILESSAWEKYIQYKLDEERGLY